MIPCIEVLVLLFLYGFAIPFLLKTHKLVNDPNKISYSEVFFEKIPIFYLTDSIINATIERLKNETADRD